MSNGGLDKSLDNRLLRSKVGDRYVAEMMKDANADIGGESSGHMLFTDGMPTGDGLYSALRVFQSAGLPPWETLAFQDGRVRQVTFDIKDTKKYLWKN